MTDRDLGAFATVFGALRRVFPLRGSGEDLGLMTSAYFKALRGWSIADVTAGAEAWIARGTKFPKPVEWREHIPRTTARTHDVRVLTDAEARAYHRAERLRYEDTPCGCQGCLDAGIASWPIRFVPEVEDGRDRCVFDPLTQRTVVAGHWAHGEDLAGYYRAQEDCVVKWRALLSRHAMGKTGKTRKPFHERIEAIFAA